MLPAILLGLIAFSTTARAVPDSLAAPVGDTIAADTTGLDSVQASATEPVHLEPLDFASLPVLGAKGRRSPNPGGWFFLLLTGLLLLMAARLLFFPGYSRRSWNALVNENLFFQLIREKTPVNPALLVMEFLVRVFVTAAVILYAAALIAGGFPVSVSDLLMVAGAFAAFLAVKSVAGLVLAALTDSGEYFRVQHLSNLVVYANASWLLLPGILVAAYLAPPFSGYAAGVVVALFGLTVMALIFRALRIVSKIGVPLSMHFFLYLCAFEIMPYLFVARIIETRLT